MTSDDSIRYSFADLALDVGTFDLLLAIVGAAPNIISSDELVDKVWSGRPASPETITQRTMMLRQALADDADNPKYVEVIRGQGLKLIPELKDAKPKPTATAIKAPRSLLTTIGAAVVVLAIVFISKDFIGSAPTASDTPPQPVRRFAIELGRTVRTLLTSVPLAGTRYLVSTYAHLINWKLARLKVPTARADLSSLPTGSGSDSTPAWGQRSRRFPCVAG
jgi:DNA-binding winged helix-turn-helix (wHTH) protein